MRGARTLLLLVLVLVPVAYFATKEYRSPTSPTDEKKLEKVFTVESDKIDEVTIKSDSGDRTTLKKAGSDWQVVVPADGGPAPADASEVSGITSNLSTLEQQRVIDDNAQDLKEFGLAEPRIEVTFKAGGQPQTLHIGAKTPTGSDVYAKIAGQNKVFLIPSYLESTFNRKTFDLRDKSALKIDAQKVDSLEVVSGPQTLKFARVNGTWQLAAPAEARTDAVAIDSLVTRVAGAQMKALAPAADLKEYGLDKPVVTARIGTGSSHATLLIGKTAAEGTVYAKDESRPAVFTLESAIADELKKDALQYRQQDLYDARAFNTTRIELTRGTEKFVFEKKNEKDKDGKDVEKWKQLAPAQKDADADKIASLLSTLTGARATSFVAKATGDKAELSAALTADGKQERVTFSRSGTDAFAVRDGVPGAAKVDTTLLDDILKTVDALR
ncbi:MAG: DUF4340 domain-containing protein [Acidobacteria bacterium]|nr:DUF4340 domain-containing protein [Acidobacteriota bacterium]